MRYGPNRFRHAQKHPKTTGCFAHVSRRVHRITSTACSIAEPGDESHAGFAQEVYELTNTGELESYTEGKSRRITVKSMDEYIERRLRARSRSTAGRSVITLQQAIEMVNSCIRNISRGRRDVVSRQAFLP